MAAILMARINGCNLATKRAADRKSLRDRTDGIVYTDITVHVVHVVEGRITEAWFFPGDQYAAADLWSRAHGSRGDRE